MFVHCAATAERRKRYLFYSRADFHNCWGKGYIGLDMSTRSKAMAVMPRIYRQWVSELDDTRRHERGRNHQGDLKNVGLYGGAMALQTFMALRRARTRSVGAALRPVTDWTTSTRIHFQLSIRGPRPERTVRRPDRIRRPASRNC